MIKPRHSHYAIRFLTHSRYEGQIEPYLIFAICPSIFVPDRAFTYSATNG